MKRQRKREREREMKRETNNIKKTGTHLTMRTITKTNIRRIIRTQNNKKTSKHTNS